MKRILYTTAVLAAVLTGCNDGGRPAGATEAGSTPKTENTADTPAVENTPAPEAAIDEADVAPKEGEVLLRLNYPKGFKQELTYNVETKGQAMMGTVGLTVNYTVTDTVNNTYTFTGAIAGINMVSETQGQKIRYNSAKKLPANASPMEQGIDKQFQGVKNKPLTFALNKKGGVVAQMQFAGDTDKESLPFDMGTYQIEFPAKPVAVGSTWTSKTADKQVGGTRTNTYTIKEINAGTVVIGVKSVLPPPPMPGAKESVFNGSYTVDRATGMLVKGTLSGIIETLGGSVTMSFTGKKK